MSDVGLERLAALTQLEHFSVGWCGKKVTEKVLLPLQSQQGWWEGRGGEERQGGKIYATSLAVLALSVKNHFLPIYQR